MEIKVGHLVNHPNYKNEVLITEIEGDMVAFTVNAPLGGGYRAWASKASFTQKTNWL